MAIVMLVVGIMLITRKKIGPQASVTIQLALPKIAIALVLITFSYTIGAIGTSLAWNLRWSVDSIVEAIEFSDETLSGLSTAGGISIIVVILIAVLTIYAGVGGFLIILYAITAAILGVLWILAWLAILKVYVKLLISVIISPISFALGAIPGNEKSTVDWFKSFIAGVISLPAVYLVIALTWATMLHLLSTLVAGTVEAFFAGALMLFVAPIIGIFGFTYARSVPEKIDALIVGAPPKRGK